MVVQYIDHNIIYFTVHLEGITVPELSNEVEVEREKKNSLLQMLNNTVALYLHGIIL